jgi:hypothetical protein
VCAFELQDRRSATRYAVTLRVELWPQSQRRTGHSDFFSTTDVSLRGFHFLSDRELAVGSRLNFSVVLPQRVTGDRLDLFTGVVEIVRKDLSLLTNNTGHFGYAARIEYTRKLHEELSF